MGFLSCTSLEGAILWFEKNQQKAEPGFAVETCDNPPLWGRKQPASTQLHAVCPDSWSISSPGLISDFLVAIPPWIERGAGGLLSPPVSGPSHAEQAVESLGVTTGVMPGLQRWWVGVLGVQRVGDSLPPHLIPPHPMALRTSYPAGFGGCEAVWWTLWSSSLNTRCLPSPGGLPRGRECGHAGWGQDGDGGLATEPLEGELQLQSLPLHCSLARTGSGRQRCSSRLNF